MKHIHLFLITVILFWNAGFSQNVGISANGIATDNSAGLDINFPDKGLLIPRVNLTSTTDIVTIASPATSLLVYNTNAGMSGGGTGYWYWDGAAWVKLSTATPATGWSIAGNAGTSPDTNFIGTNDNIGLSLRTNNIEAIHIDSLQHVGIGVINTSNKFEVAGSFSMHRDSFNMLHTTDLFPTLLPGVQFTGSTYSMPSENGTYLSGVADTPPAAGDNTYAISGYLDLAANTQNLFLANSAGMMMNSQSPTTNSSINLDNTGSLNLNTNRGLDTSSNINFSTNGINIYNNINAIGNTYMNFSDSSVILNTNESVDNSRNTGLQVRPNDYKIYNNDNAAGTSSGYNFSSTGFSHNINDNNQNINSFLGGQSGQLKLYLNNNANNTQSGFDITQANAQFFNNDNGLGNTAGYNLNNNSFSVNIYNSTDNRSTNLNIDQNNLNFNQYNNTAGSSSNINLSDNGVSFASNSVSESASFLMTGSTASFTSGNTISLGVGTNTPKSYFETAGSFGTSITTTGGDMTLDNTHYTVIVTGGPAAITLPAAGADNYRRSYRIINQTSTGVDISSFINFSGASALIVPANSKIEVQSDGSSWYQVD